MFEPQGARPHAEFDLAKREPFGREGRQSNVPATRPKSIKARAVRV